VSGQPGRQAGRAVDLVLRVALDEQVGAMVSQGRRGAVEDRQLVALDVDLDEADAVPAVGVEGPGLDCQLFDAGDRVVGQRVGRLDRGAAELLVAGVVVGQAHRDAAGLGRQRDRLDPATSPVEDLGQHPVEQRDRLERDHVRGVGADPVRVHADLGADVDAGARRVAQDRQERHLALVVGARQSSPPVG
jgi:hypothetical protein